MSKRRPKQNKPSNRKRVIVRDGKMMVVMDTVNGEHCFAALDQHNVIEHMYDINSLKDQLRAYWRHSILLEMIRDHICKVRPCRLIHIPDGWRIAMHRGTGAGISMRKSYPRIRNSSRPDNLCDTFSILLTIDFVTDYDEEYHKEISLEVPTDLELTLSSSASQSEKMMVFNAWCKAEQEKRAENSFTELDSLATSLRKEYPEAFAQWAREVNREEFR